MRIIAGAWRGRTIEAPPGVATRPTGDRVRETLFSMLANRLGSFEELRVADLFAGSGALGLEALAEGITIERIHYGSITPISSAGPEAIAGSR